MSLIHHLELVLIHQQNPKGQEENKEAPRCNGREKEDNLSSVTETLDFHSEKEKTCNCCGKVFEDFPGTEDSEEIVIEVRAYKRVLKRKRY